VEQDEEGDIMEDHLVMMGTVEDELCYSRSNLDAVVYARTLYTARGHQWHACHDEIYSCTFSVALGAVPF
jgi:hypothetical protein